MRSGTILHRAIVTALKDPENLVYYQGFSFVARDGRVDLSELLFLRNRWPFLDHPAGSLVLDRVVTTERNDLLCVFRPATSNNRQWGLADFGILRIVEADRIHGIPNTTAINREKIAGTSELTPRQFIGTSGQKSVEEVATTHQSGKAVWEMTFAEYRQWAVDNHPHGQIRRSAKSRKSLEQGTCSAMDIATVRANAVLQAHLEGKVIPDHVLGDYPDLCKKHTSQDMVTESESTMDAEFIQFSEAA